MKKTFATITATLAFCGFCSLSSAECVKPAPPSLPNPDEAVTPEMVKANNEVKAFMTAANDYLQCIDDAAKHNEMVAEMEKLAEHFNGIIRKYKARLNQ